MKKLAAVVTSLSLVTSALAQTDQGLRITRNGSQPSTAGPGRNFTGNGVSQIAIAEQPDGKSVAWLEKVTDAQYRNAR